MARTTKAGAKGGAKATIDHDEIRRWVEERGGKPAVVKRTTGGRQPGILRVDFPGFSGEQSLEELDWDEWFKRFDDASLAFLHQDETGSGKISRFNKLVAREGVAVRNGKRPSRRATGGARGRARRGAASGGTAKRVTAARGRAASRTDGRTKRKAAETRRGRSTTASRSQGGTTRAPSRAQRGRSASTATKRRGSSTSSRSPRASKRAKR